MINYRVHHENLRWKNMRKPVFCIKGGAARISGGGNLDDLCRARASGGQAADVASNSRRLAANHCTPSRAHLGKFALKIVSWENHIEGVPVATLSQVWGFSATVEKRGGSWGIACRQCCTSAGQSWLKFAFERKLHIKDNPSLHLLKVYLANAGK